MIDKILSVYISVWATFGVICISAKPASIWNFSEKSDNFVFFLPSPDVQFYKRKVLKCSMIH